MPDWRVSDLRIMYKFFQVRGMIAETDELIQDLKLLGHKPRNFEDFAKEAAEQWKEEWARAA